MKVRNRQALATGQPDVARQYAAVPWRMRSGFLEVMLVTSRRRGRWIVPKGWRVKGRSPSESAEREALEEAGVIGHVGTEPIGSYHYSWPGEDGSRELRHVTVFGLHVLGTLVDWPEKGQRKRMWWPLDAACEAVAEPGLAELLRSLSSHSGSAGRSVLTGPSARQVKSYHFRQATA
jgi:8-oxo-dGTP pyrophosphatase MutT (NUDIX family)